MIERRPQNSSPRALSRVVWLATCAWIVLSASGCGYVRVRVTPLPDTPTPTPPVRLTVPGNRATSTPVPSTPLPTATPTATPTPVIHVVQKGENLLGIAYEYGVDVQSLIEINEIENPRALQIGQQIIIPPDDEALLAARPTATPTPMPLNVVNLGWHRTPVGSLWCMGEVENERDEFLDNVQVQALLYDVKGTLIGKADGFTAVDVLPGHGKAPFALLFPDPPAGGFASYQVTVLSAEPVTHWGRRHRKLTVEQLAGEMESGNLVVRGTVHNRGEEEAAAVRLVVTAYGSSGEVVAVRQLDTPDLAPGAHHSFSDSLIPAAPAVQVQAVAWGLKPLP